MTEPIVTTPSVTPEEMDSLYPVPTWATKVYGGNTANDRNGWGWDVTDYSRFLRLDGPYVKIIVGESRDAQGKLLSIEGPFFKLPDPNILDMMCVGHNARHVLGQLIEHLRKAETIIPEVLGYIDGVRLSNSIETAQ